MITLVPLIPPLTPLQFHLYLHSHLIPPLIPPLTPSQLHSHPYSSTHTSTHTSYLLLLSLPLSLSLLSWSPFLFPSPSAVICGCLCPSSRLPLPRSSTRCTRKPSGNPDKTRQAITRSSITWCYHTAKQARIAGSNHASLVLDLSVLSLLFWAGGNDASQEALFRHGCTRLSSQPQ